MNLKYVNHSDFQGQVMRRIKCLSTGILSALLFGQIASVPAVTDSGIPLPNQPLEVTPNAVTTLLDSDNSFAGNTFDLRVVGESALKITGFDINLIDGDAPTTHTVTVYYREGTSFGNETDATAWTLLGTDNSVVSEGLDTATHVDVGGLTLQPRQVYGIYIDLASFDGVDLIAYTNGGPTVYVDDNLQLKTNSGQGNPAFSSTFSPRQFNGRVYYDFTSEGSEPVPVLSNFAWVVAFLLLAVLGIYMLNGRKEEGHF